MRAESKLEAMWQAIEILLIATFGSEASELNGAERYGNLNGQPAAQAGELYPAVVVDQGVAAPAAPAAWPIRPEDPAPPNAAGCLHDSPGWFAGPCVFDNYWDVSGGRPPTDYLGTWAYGPDCTVARARVEWLLWFSRGRQAPVLVSAATAGTSTTAGTTHTFPDGPIGQNVRNGARITLGHLLADEVTWLEGRFWGVENSASQLSTNSSQTPTILQPYFDVVANRSLGDIVAAPGLASGSIRELSRNSFFGADAWLRSTWWDDGRNRFDFLAGYQFTRLDDSIVIDRSSTTLVASGSAPAGFRVDVHDAFRTQNEFHGGTLGFVSEWRKSVVSMELLGKMGLGNVYQRVAIEGNSTGTLPGGPTTALPHGFFAEPSNIGDHHRNRFTFIPELNLNGVLHFSPQWRAMIGYSLLYWNNVVLAGNQIDPRINLSQNPPGPLVGPLLPQFQFVRHDFWIQGVSLGTEYRW